MFGVSYGELFLLLGATAALIGPKDLPVISRVAGRLAGRAIGYVQLARGQLDNVMQQSQAREVHKELQDTKAQLEAVLHEIRSITSLNPGPLTRRINDNIDQTPDSNGLLNSVSGGLGTESTAKTTVSESFVEPKGAGTLATAMISKTSDSCNMHSQATAYARLAEVSALKNGTDVGNLIDDAGLLNVLPLSAKSTGMLPHQPDDVKGSDIVLEAILEAEVAQNAKEFFSKPENQIKCA